MVELRTGPVIQQIAGGMLTVEYCVQIRDSHPRMGVLRQSIFLRNKWTKQQSYPSCIRRIFTPFVES